MKLIKQVEAALGANQSKTVDSGAMILDLEVTDLLGGTKFQRTLAVSGRSFWVASSDSKHHVLLSRDGTARTKEDGKDVAYGGAFLPAALFNPMDPLATFREKINDPAYEVSDLVYDSTEKPTTASVTFSCVDPVWMQSVTKQRWTFDLKTLLPRSVTFGDPHQKRSDATVENMYLYEQFRQHGGRQLAEKVKLLVGPRPIEEITLVRFDDSQQDADDQFTKEMLK
ncbi:hypothetical protein [Terriglobus tenax]|uniref:hypothetical protein n=1 Tax=Terriglobus tenax TaxID=1111115 RepID=UPI0021E0564C|nr:hypothetical protein [Terriglobus tenax]